MFVCVYACVVCDDVIGIIIKELSRASRRLGSIHYDGRMLRVGQARLLLLPYFTNA